MSEQQNRWCVPVMDIFISWVSFLPWFEEDRHSEEESGIAVATVSGSLASLELAVRTYEYEDGHGITGTGYSGATTDPMAILAKILCKTIPYFLKLLSQFGDCTSKTLS
ncbi:unnamed protein product [Acanthoscelides obtectus]|nr:unnamed protein product [Acanthoscelides obtectus]CAK1664300.1 hypothetical protein AOBTE_LOCUS24184 [Acanthoscelides obtectus]